MERSWRLTPFEEYMLADDRPRWPMAFFAKFGVRGQLNREACAAALRAAAAEHPLLSSVVYEDERGRVRWRYSPELQAPLDWSDDDAPIDLASGRPIDLRTNVGLRVWVRRAGDETALWMQMHHACCDGAGALRFAADFFRFYRERADVAAVPAPSELNPARLGDRGRFGLTPLRQLARIPQELLGLLGAVEFFSHRPPDLLSQPMNGQAHDLSGEYPAMLTHRFSAEDSLRLRQRARDERVTFNDFLLAAMFQTLDVWFAERNPSARKKFFRVMVPVDLRGAGDGEMPAANMVSMVNLDRRPSRYRTRRKLLKSLSLEMAIIKRCRLGITFHQLARLVRKFGKMSVLLPEDRCMCTCVLSNLGEPAVLRELAAARDSGAPGGIDLVSVEGLPPIRPRTAAAFAVITYRGCTSITLHYDAALTREGADKLLKGFVRELETDLGA